MGDAYIIDKVYGSPESELSTGQLMRINTLFPSAKDEQGQTKGGVVLLRLLRKNSSVAEDGTLKLRVSYEIVAAFQISASWSFGHASQMHWQMAPMLSSRTRVFAKRCFWPDTPRCFNSG